MKRPPRILMTMGGMREFLDDVRFIANESSGKLGLEILNELSNMKVKADVLCGWTPTKIHTQIKGHHVVLCESYESMRSHILEAHGYDVGIFAAAVLDFIPEKKFEGKISSEKESLHCKFVRTEKLVDLFCQKNPQAKLMTFKLESRLSDQELIATALESNMNRPWQFIMANHKTDVTEDSYRGFLISRTGHIEVKSRGEIAQNPAVGFWFRNCVRD